MEAPVNDEIFTDCPKCRAVSGGDWSQCKGSCPMGGTHYDISIDTALHCPPGRLFGVSVNEYGEAV